MEKRPLGKSIDAAIRLDSTEPRVNEMARAGLFDGVVVQLGRQRRWDLDRLEEWIENGGKALLGGWKHEPDDRAA